MILIKAVCVLPMYKISFHVRAEACLELKLFLCYDSFPKYNTLYGKLLFQYLSFDGTQFNP